MPVQSKSTSATAKPAAKASWEPKIQGVTDESGVSEREAQEKLRAMGNRKCISSEEIFGNRDHKSDEVVKKYQQLTGAKAISSDMFFDREEK